MWDSIFVLINHFDKPYKKKDIHYLINSRINNGRKESVILYHDINILDKCNQCRAFQPWIMLKNSGEGLFLLKKFIEKCEPWITVYLQKNYYEDVNLHDDLNFFVLIRNKIDSRRKFYNLINNYQDIILNSDIRIKNQCYECKFLSPWIFIKNNRKGIELIKILNDKFKPFIILKKQKLIYKHNIPKKIIELEKWSWKKEMRFGNLKIEI